MDIYTIKVPPNLSPEADRKEYVDRFGDDNFPELHIEESVEHLRTVLDWILIRLLGKSGKIWVALETVDVADKCALLHWGFDQIQGREPAFYQRMHEHVAAVEHFDRERSRLLRAELQRPGCLTWTEKAEVADNLMCAAMELNEGMICEHDDLSSALSP